MSAAPKLESSAEAIMLAYLAAEEASSVRHALHNGEIFAMAGGSTVHALLSARAAALLDRALDGRPCAALSGDQRVHINETNVTYPDVVVACPPLERPPLDRHGISNPTLLVEVLSPSTEQWDRGGKLRLYRSIPSLRHVLFIAQTHWRVELWSRGEDGVWWLHEAGPGGAVHLAHLGLSIEVDALYARSADFGGPGPEAPAPPETPTLIADRLP
jgi:Uma2 family endonuclease